MPGREGAAMSREVFVSDKIRPHCWKDRTEYAAERFGFGSDQWAKAFAKGGGTCLLPSGHAGPHRFTSDSKIVVKFK